jgi:hypothetical protein
MHSPLCPLELYRLNTLHDIRNTLKTASFYAILSNLITRNADPTGCAVQGVDLQPLAFWNLGSNPAKDMNVFLCCVLSGRGLCVGPITCPEDSYRVWCV